MTRSNEVGGTALFKSVLRPGVRVARRLSRAARGIPDARELRRRRPRVPRRVRTGVNLVGYLRAELGVGEAARRISLGLDAARIPYAPIPYWRTGHRQEHPFTRASAAAPYDVNVVCVNADQLPLFATDVGKALFARRVTVGVWFWEVSVFPAAFHGAFDLVDEIWVASEFVRDALVPHTQKPVLVFPLPVAAESASRLTRAELGLPDGFLFFFSFDFRSVFERKNPLAVVEAFRRAFAPGEGATLLVKSINGDTDPGNLERLQQAAAQHPDVRVVDGFLSWDKNAALVETCDCYVSLHRSEGFGLTIADAIAAGKPAIATGYSGNLAYMDSSSHVVGYRLTGIPAGAGPYPAGAEWADPDLDEASAAMRRVFECSDEATLRAARAQSQLVSRLSPHRCGEFIAGRLEEIRSARGYEATSAAGVLSRLRSRRR